MDIIWKIGPNDIKAAKEIVGVYRQHPMVRDRLTRNLVPEKPIVSRSRFWKALVAALLTTQQRSGPSSAVARFINSRPFPLTYRLSCQHDQAKAFFSNVLSSFGGIRRRGKIADELVANLCRLNDGLWLDIRDRLKQLCATHTRNTEIAVAEFIDDELEGFGPKQARNLLQGLGLTRYEIPIDSRITKWLNGIRFPVHLSATGLSDRAYCNFVMDGVYQLCKSSRISPCVLDAAVFSSYDGDGWTKANVGW